MLFLELGNDFLGESVKYLLSLGYWEVSRTHHPIRYAYEIWPSGTFKECQDMAAVKRRAG